MLITDVLSLELPISRHITHKNQTSFVQLRQHIKKWCRFWLITALTKCFSFSNEICYWLFYSLVSRAWNEKLQQSRLYGSKLETGSIKAIIYVQRSIIVWNTSQMKWVKPLCTACKSNPSPIYDKICTYWHSNSIDA